MALRRRAAAAPSSALAAKLSLSQAYEMGRRGDRSGGVGTNCLDAVILLMGLLQDTLILLRRTSIPRRLEALG